MFSNVTFSFLIIPNESDHVHNYNIIKTAIQYTSLYRHHAGPSKISPIMPYLDSKCHLDGCFSSLKNEDVFYLVLAVLESRPLYLKPPAPFEYLFFQKRPGNQVKQSLKSKKSISKKAPPPPIYFSRFVAIDFETADYGSDSACAVGLVRVENRRIVDRLSLLIRPPRRYFQFTWLHGIAWEDVAGEPTFGELWPRMAPLFKGVEFIAAHNASFDRRVLDECCLQYHRTPPACRYLCTMRLARRLWDIRPTKLSDVCGEFDIPLQHHHAGSDAWACAKIVLRAEASGVPEGAFLKPSKKKITTAM